MTEPDPVAAVRERHRRMQGVLIPSFTEHDIACAHADRATLLRVVEELREALDKYGSHGEQCRYLATAVKSTCDCGLLAILEPGARRE